MHTCHHHLELIDIGISPNGIGIIFILFVTGLISSFTHCIGMCGSIALAQANMRLMHLQANNVTQTSRWQIAFATPYYLGKTSTYILLAITAFYITKNTIISENFYPLIGIGLLFICLMLLLNLLKRNLQFNFIRKINNAYVKFINKFIKRLNFITAHPFGIRGFFYGMLLGLIPCNLVIVIITAAVTNAANIIILCTSVAAFGLATIPGLFLFAWLGQHFLSKHKVIFNIAYNVVIGLNIILIGQYALKLL